MGVGCIHRLLQLMTTLQSGQRFSVEDLAAHLCVSRRTVFRALNMLHDAGITCYQEARHGYRIASHFLLPPVDFTVSETL